MKVDIDYNKELLDFVKEIESKYKPEYKNKIDDLLQKGANFFIFDDNQHIPFWLVMLWACFGATLCHSLRFLAEYKILQILVGGGFAPLSYLAGYQFQVVEFGSACFDINYFSRLCALYNRDSYEQS